MYLSIHCKCYLNFIICIFAIYLLSCCICLKLLTRFCIMSYSYIYLFDMFYIQRHCMPEMIYGTNKIWYMTWYGTWLPVGPWVLIQHVHIPKCSGVLLILKTYSGQDLNFFTNHCYILQVLCQTTISNAVQLPSIQFSNVWSDPITCTEKYQQNPPELEINSLKEWIWILDMFQYCEMLSSPIMITTLVTNENCVM
jgi:hypothetical protein